MMENKNLVNEAMEITDTDMENVAGGAWYHGVQNVFLKAAGKCHEYTDANGKKHQGSASRMNALKAADDAKLTQRINSNNQICEKMTDNAKAALRRGDREAAKRFLNYRKNARTDSQVATLKMNGNKVNHI